jgi:hypothetical protein
MLRHFRERLVYNDLPGGTRRYFDDLTPEMTWLGFRQLADRRVKRGLVVRHFLSADGRTVGELFEFNPLPFYRIRTFAFISVLADGTYVETCPLKAPQVDRRAAERFRLVGIQRATPEQALARHRQAVDELVACHGAAVVALEPDEVRKVGNYGHQLVAWDMRLKAGRDSDPPEFPLAGRVAAGEQSDGRQEDCLAASSF